MICSKKYKMSVLFSLAFAIILMWCGAMVNQERIDYLEKELKEINDEIDKEKNNLIYMLTNMEIEDINLYGFYLKINDLINQKKIVADKIKYEKLDF